MKSGQGMKIPVSKKSEQPSKMIFFDTESRVDIKITDEELEKVLRGEKVTKKHDLFLLCACFVNTKNKEPEEWKDYIDNIIPFWYDVANYCKSKEKVIVFAHNAKYDILVSGAVTELVKYGYTVQSFSEDNPFFIKFEDEENKKSIMLLSTTNYFKTSIYELGKIIDLPKLDFDFSEANIKEGIPYCRRDVEIMMKTMLNYLKFMKDEDLGSFAITIAGQAFCAYRHKFMKHDIYLHRKKDSVILERSSYSGGRTECFRIGDFSEPVYYYDVNSMYPFVMSNYKYPYKLISSRKTITKTEILDYINDDFLVISKCLVKTDKRIYTKKTNKLIFPVGTYWTYLNTEEIKYGLKHNLILACAETNIYDSAELFKEYVDYFYKKRLEAKAKGDKINDLFFKLYLNCLYGKFGQKNIHWEKIEDIEDVTEIYTERIFDSETGKIETYKVFGGGKFKQLEEIEGESEGKYSFCAIASHVTSNARMLLYRIIEIAGYENIYYMDTDSIMCNETGKNKLEASGILNDKELGKLKLEDEIFNLKIKGCKDYSYDYLAKKDIPEKNIKVGDVLSVNKIKGVNIKNSIKIDDNTYVSTVWRGMSKYIKRGDMTGYENELMVKRLKRNYDKGIIENTIVSPIVLNELIPEDEKFIKFFNQ